MKTLVLGLGNPLLSDDAIGLLVARKIRARLGDRPDVDVDEEYHGGLRLMERMVGYDKGIIVDAICTGDDPGKIHRLRGDTLPTQHSASAHDMSLQTALAFGREEGADLPDTEDILFFGIEAADVSTFSECCTPEVEAAIPRAVEAVISALEEGGTRDGVA